MAEARVPEESFCRLLDFVDEGCFVAEVLFDDAGRPADVVYLAANATGLRIAGQEVVGRRLSELEPGVDRARLDLLARVARSGKSERLAEQVERAEACYEVSVVPLAGESAQVGIVFRDVTERERLEKSVAERTRKLADLSAERQQLLAQLVTATEEERQRVARELHDQLGQHITALKVGLEALQPQSEAIERMKRIVADLDRSVDRLTLELRPPALDDLGLHGAISSLIEQFTESSGIRAEVHLAGIDGARLPDPVESTLYRVLQEALTNVWKHARASCVSVVVDRQPESLQMIIEDDGAGFDTDGGSAGFGVPGMRERLALIGGSLNIESAPGSGAALYVRVPLGYEQRA